MTARWMAPSLKRVILSAAGTNRGVYTLRQSDIAGYADALVTDGYAVRDGDTITLTGAGWDVFYAITGWDPAYYGPNVVAGQETAP